MTSSLAASASRKTPFEAIAEAEQNAAHRIAHEEQKLHKELENAKKRNAEHEELRKKQISEAAREELQREKAAMGGVLEQGIADAERECAAIEKAAKAAMPRVAEKLAHDFFSLT